MLAWSGAVLALALAVRLVDLGGAGQTWDEDVNWSAGRDYVTNLLSGDFSASSWRWNFEHPPVTKYVAGIGAQFADGYGPARALSALLVALGCALLVPIGRRMFSLRVGVLAGAVAAFTPHLIAHGKVVGHEAPAVFLWTLAVWLALGAHDRPEGLSVRQETSRLCARLALLGVVLGLAISSRFVNVLLAPLVGAILLVQAPRGERMRTVLIGAIVVPAVALAIGFAIWPRLWGGPLAGLEASWEKLRVPHAAEPFLGHITNEPSRAYFAVYLAATAPIGVLIGAVAWLVRALRRRERSSLVLALWLLVPLVVSLSPVRQDGVRYILPSLVALALASAAGVDWVVSLIERRVAVGGGRAFAGASALVLVYLVVTCWRIHPYYLDYYGEQVGGTVSVGRRKSFEVAWWGEGLADAIDYVNRHAEPDARVHRACVEPSHLTWLRGDLWRREARRPDDADWIVVYQPLWRACPLPADAVLAHEVLAQGAPLVRVYRRGDRLAPP